MEGKEFLEHLKKECDKKGVKLILGEGSKIPYSTNSALMVSGYFEDFFFKDRAPELACAIGKPEQEWMKILIHESCHMDQWVEYPELWLSQYSEGKNSDRIMDNWISGKNFSEQQYTHAIRTMQAIEIDCEKRSAQKIIDLGLPINVSEYIKNANSYVLFYSIILKTRAWYEKPPYETSEVLAAMPDHWLDDYTEVSDELFELYKKYCF